MSMDDITPDRLDAILDGDAPATDAEREILHLAADLRAASPTPSTDLRRRIRALGEPTMPARAPRKIRWGLLAPALGALVAALVATTLVLQNSSDDASVAGNDPAVSEAQTEMSSTGTALGDGAAAPAPGSAAQRAMDSAPTWTLRPGTRSEVLSDVQAAASAAGGRVELSAAGDATLVLVTVAPDARAGLVERLLAIAADRADPASPAPVAPDDSAPLAFRLREAAG